MRERPHLLIVRSVNQRRAIKTQAPISLSMGLRFSRRLLTVAWMCAALLLGQTWLSAFGARVHAEDSARTEVLLRVLSTSPSFRVRVQAAMALSHMPAEPRTVAALKQATSDPHPSVREACVAALGVLKEPAQRDPVRANQRAKYYVLVGETSAKTAVSADTLRAMRAHVVSLVAGLDGVRLAPAGEDQATARRVVTRDALVGYSVESVVHSLERRGDAVRAQVAVVIATYPGRNIQAMLTGSAQVSGSGNGEAAQRKAAEVAFASALKRLPSVLDSSRLEARASAPAATASARRP